MLSLKYILANFCFVLLLLKSSMKICFIIALIFDFENHLTPHLYLHIHLNHPLILQTCKTFLIILTLLNSLLHFIAMPCSLNSTIRFHYFLMVFFNLVKFDLNLFIHHHFTNFHHLLFPHLLQPSLHSQSFHLFF